MTHMAMRKVFAQSVAKKLSGRINRIFRDALLRGTGRSFAMLATECLHDANDDIRDYAKRFLSCRAKVTSNHVILVNQV